VKPLKVFTYNVAAPVLDAKMETPHQVTVLPEGSDAEIAELLADADALVLATFKASWRSPRGPGPRLVHSVGAGTDGIDFKALPAGCRVCNVYGHERGVAETAFTHMLVLLKHLLPIDRAMRRGNWTPERPYLTELRGRRLLILGFGHIGAELARWGQFMEMKVTALTRSPDKARGQAPAGCTVGGLSELKARLPEADFVVLAIPATGETTGIIGEAELRLMKPTAFIVNVGRGPLIDEKALYEALRDRRIGGAGLDVWYQYPVGKQDRLPAQQPFHELDNVVMSAHKPTVETMEYRFPEIAKNLDRLARGEPLKNQVWPHA